MYNMYKDLTAFDMMVMDDIERSQKVSKMMNFIHEDMLDRCANYPAYGSSGFRYNGNCILRMFDLENGLTTYEMRRLREMLRECGNFSITFDD